VARAHGRVAAVILAAMLLAAAGCLPDFKNPLPAPKDLKVDTDIVGAWSRTKLMGESEVLLVLPRRNGWVSVYYFDCDADSDHNPTLSCEFEGYTVRVKGERFFCFRVPPQSSWNGRGEKPKPPPFRIARYQITDKGRLRVDLFAIGPVDKLIKKGSLAGKTSVTVTRSKMGDRRRTSVLVTSSSQDLLAAVTKHGFAAFVDQDDPWVYERFNRKHLLPREPAGAGE